MRKLLPLLLIAILGIATLAVKLFFAPSPGSAEWASFHVILISAVSLVGFLIWNWFFPSYPGCNLFFYFQKETNEHGNWRGREGLCLDASVNSVDVEEAECSTGKYVATGRRYFCRVHDPRHPWMQKWLREHKIRARSETIRELRFIDKNP